jgi:tRNA pseudouridine38-40 synthase
MRREARFLIGKHDFKSFEATDHERGAHSTVRTIKYIKITKKDNWIVIDIKADGFLYKMVRNIVGCLLDVGAGRLPKGGVKTILEHKNRCRAGETAEPQGLCLLDVKY